MFARPREPLTVVLPAPLRRRRSLSAPLTLTPLRLSGGEQLSATVRSSLPDELSCLSPLQSPLSCLPTVGSTVDGSPSSTPRSLRCAWSPPSSPSKMWSIRGLHEEPAGGICVTRSRAMNSGPFWIHQGLHTSARQPPSGTPRAWPGVSGPGAQPREIFSSFNGNFQAKSTHHTTYRTSLESSH